MVETPSLAGLVAALVVVLCLPALAYAGAAFAPETGSYVVSSGSMEPSVPTGSLVFVREGSYEVGDVVTFDRPGGVVTHRIVGTDSDRYVTKGDANGEPDGWTVREDQIVGEVILVLPWYGSVLAVARSPLGYAAFVLVPGLLLLAREIAVLRERA